MLGFLGRSLVFWHDESGRRSNRPGQQDSVAGLIEWLASPGRSSSVNLGEMMIHQQDVRRPLGLTRTFTQDRLALILNLSLTRSGSLSLVPVSRKASKDLRFVATDLNWSSGRGLEVDGPGEAILMAVNGRKGAVADLTGPGAGTLASRIAE
jgi:hypothetical protein